MNRITWLVLALVAIVALVLSDITNNLSVVGLFSDSELSWWGWSSLAVGVAMAPMVLGYAANQRPLYWMLAFLAALISSILTLMSVNTDFYSRSQNSQASTSVRAGLESERDTLIGSLPACRAARWCKSADKEARIAQINSELSSLSIEVDPLKSSKYGADLGILIAVLRAFVVPLVVAGLGNFVGILLGTHAPQKIPNYSSIQGSFDETSSENSRKKQGKPAPKKDSVLMASEWLASQKPGQRISKLKLKRGAKATRQELDTLAQQLIKRGELERMSNGQLRKPGQAGKSKVITLFNNKEGK